MVFQSVFPILTCFPQGLDAFFNPYNVSQSIFQIFMFFIFNSQTLFQSLYPFANHLSNPTLRRFPINICFSNPPLKCHVSCSNPQTFYRSLYYAFPICFSNSKFFFPSVRSIFNPYMPFFQSVFLIIIYFFTVSTLRRFSNF